MNGLGWVGTAVTAIFVVAGFLAVLRRSAVAGRLGRGASAASFVLLVALVAAAATGGYFFWRRQVAEAMAPEK
ncbi:MAG: hypothetical protein IT452_13305 [Planctomycetia bacterium]|nr:hypothetical protein [Planctomycetia bacterium]